MRRKEKLPCFIFTQPMIDALASGHSTIFSLCKYKIICYEQGWRIIIVKKQNKKSFCSSRKEKEEKYSKVLSNLYFDFHDRHTLFARHLGNKHAGFRAQRVHTQITFHFFLVSLKAKLSLSNIIMSDILYCENPEWADVTPIPQDDGPNPLVPIAYSKECRYPTNSLKLFTDQESKIDSDAMDYFRAVTRTNEKSERVLTLIQDIIDMNPAHYTVW